MEGWLSVHGHFEWFWDEVCCGLVLLHVVPLHDLPLFVEPQVPRPSRSLLPVQHRGVGDVVVLKNRLLKLALGREMLGGVEEAFVVHGQIQLGLDALDRHNSKANGDEVEDSVGAVFILCAVNGAVRLHLQLEALTTGEPGHYPLQLGLWRSLSLPFLPGAEQFDPREHIEFTGLVVGAFAVAGAAAAAALVLLLTLPRLPLLADERAGDGRSPGHAAAGRAGDGGNRGVRGRGLRRPRLSSHQIPTAAVSVSSIGASGSWKS